MALGGESRQEILAGGVPRGDEDSFAGVVLVVGRTLLRPGEDSKDEGIDEYLETLALDRGAGEEMIL